MSYGKLAQRSGAVDKINKRNKDNRLNKHTAELNKKAKLQPEFEKYLNVPLLFEEPEERHLKLEKKKKKKKGQYLNLNSHLMDEV